MIVVCNGATQETFKVSICNFSLSKICKKRIHRNDQKNLPWDFKKCTGSLHFTLLEVFLKTDALERKYLPDKIVIGRTSHSAR